MPPRSRSLRVSTFAAALASLATVFAPAPAAAAKPTAAELTQLVDGRIPDLESVASEEHNVAVAPGGQQIAFIAHIANADHQSIDDALWTIKADGSSLREVLPDSPGATHYYEHYWTPQWSPSGRYLSVGHSFPHAPRSVTLVFDLTAPASAEPVSLDGGVNFVYTAGEKYIVAQTGGPSGWPNVTAYELATGKSAQVQHGDGIPARNWSWGGACRGAERAGVPATGSPSEVAAQFTGPHPGCRFFPAKPTAAQVTEIVDGRIPGLLSIGEVSANAAGDAFAFVARVDPPNRYASTDQLWAVGAGGADLRRVEGSFPVGAPFGDNAVAFEISALQWGPGEYISYLLNYGHSETPATGGYWTVIRLEGSTTTLVERDYVERLQYSADGRHAAALSPLIVVPQVQDVSVIDLGSGAWARALERDGGAWQWTQACTDAGAVPTGDLLAATLAQVDGEPRGCSLTAPTAVELPADVKAGLALIDGRIPGLVGLAAPVYSPDGSKVAFQAQIHHPEAVSVEPAIWIANSDGSGLRLVRELPGGWSQYNEGLHFTGWSPSGRFLSYIEYHQTRPKSTIGFVDTGTGVTKFKLPSAGAGLAFSADDRFAVFASREESGNEHISASPADGAEPFALVTQRRTAERIEWAWAPACAAAADAGLVPSSELETLAALLVGPNPKCAWPAPPRRQDTTKTDDKPGGGETPKPTPTTPAPQQPLTGTSPPPGGTTTVVPKAPKLVISKRLWSTGGDLTWLRVKVATAGAARVKAYVIEGGGAAKRTLGRASAPARGATTILTLSFEPRSTAAAKKRRTAAALTLRVVSTTKAGVSTTSELPLKLD